MTIASRADAGDFPAQSFAPRSLLQKHLTASVWNALKSLTTASGVTLQDCMRSGLTVADSTIGLYAGDAESLERFGLLFAPLIHDCHPGFQGIHAHNVHLVAGTPLFANPDPEGRYILSTRMRLARNLHGYRLMPAITRSELLAVEQRALKLFGQLSADLTGSYYPLGSNHAASAGAQPHPGFAAADRFQQAAGIGRDWPEGRGVFANPARTLQIWVNEEDHLRVISVQAGADVNAVYACLLRATEAMAPVLDFQMSDIYGYVTSCPSNLGTGLRASFHIHLPLSGNSPAFRQLCAGHHMEVRSASGEDGQQSGDLYDISHKRRLGLTPVQCIQELLGATAEIIALEQRASA